jgi:hypothetical protein
VASLVLGTFSLVQIGSLNIRPWEVLLGTFIIVVFIMLCMGKRFLYPNKISIVILLPLILCVLLSGFNANSSDIWIKQGMLLLAMLLLFSIVSQRWSRAQILQNIRWIIYPGILAAGWGILELLLDPADLPSYYLNEIFTPRARSLFKEPNEFSQFLALPFAFLFAAILYQRKVSLMERWFFGVGIFIVILAQLLSLSRGGLVVFIFEIFAWLILTRLYSVRDLHRFRIRKLLWYFVIIIMTGSLLAGSSIFDFFDIFFDRIQTLFSGDDITSNIRWNSIIAAVSETVNSPVNFIFGMGLGNLSIFFGGSGTSSDIATTSNTFVDIFSELGLLGFISFNAILVTAFILPIRTLKQLVREKDDEMLVSFFGAYLSFVGLVAGGLTYANHMLNFFWFSCGLIFALYKYTCVSYTREKLRSDYDHN